MVPSTYYRRYYTSRNLVPISSVSSTISAIRLRASGTQAAQRLGLDGSHERLASFHLIQLMIQATLTPSYKHTHSLRRGRDGSERRQRRQRGDAGRHLLRQASAILPPPQLLFPALLRLWVYVSIYKGHQKRRESRARPNTHEHAGKGQAAYTKTARLLCRLTEESSPTPANLHCDGGTQERRRGVFSEIRGQGEAQTAAPGVAAPVGI